jgi:chromatin remodeling complex protein RSC6
VEAGTEMAHTDVTKHVINYIKDHSLQDEQNRRVIIPDKKLSGLLQPGTQDTITFFNLQTFMKHHYLNPNKPKVPAATVASTSLASN